MSKRDENQRSSETIFKCEYKFMAATVITQLGLFFEERHDSSSVISFGTLMTVS